MVAASQPRKASSFRAQRKSGRRAPRPAQCVLIVDDSVHVREMYAEYLDYRGFRVMCAADGNGGIQLAISVQPDVIVMDLAMPNVDGFDATRTLKRHSRTSRIPIVILTGYSDVATLKQGALQAGADMFLAKPCLPEDLERHVRSLLERQPRRAENQRAGACAST
jgi:two-component system, cell cycle response regulator DivK